MSVKVGPENSWALGDLTYFLRWTCTAFLNTSSPFQHHEVAVADAVIPGILWLWGLVAPQSSP